MAAQAAEPDRLAVAAALEELGSLVRRLGARQDLSLTTISVLARLASSGPARITALALQEKVSQPSMTQLVSRLERQGLARRRASIDGSRIVNVHITRRGRELLVRRHEERAHRLATLLRKLPAEEEAAITAALPALRLLVLLAPTLEVPASPE